MDKQDPFDSGHFLFSTFNINKTDKVIGILEHSLADGNFVLTYLIKWILSNDRNKICLVNFHHTLTHYQSIGKRLGFDILTKIKDGDVVALEPMKVLVEKLSEAENKTNFSENSVAKDLILEIKTSIETLAENRSADELFLVIDDISHLLDSGVELKEVVAFLNCCANFSATFVVLTHISNNIDTILGNALRYIADLFFEVMPLKTGVSRDVTGILKFKRRRALKNPLKKEEDVYHFKALEKEVKIFLPGEVMHLFYK